MQTNDEHVDNFWLCSIQAVHCVDKKEYEIQNGSYNAQSIEYQNYKLRAKRLHDIITEQAQLILDANHNNYLNEKSFQSTKIKNHLSSDALMQNFVKDFHHHAVKNFA